MGPCHHPLLEKCRPTIPSLPDHERVWTFLAGHTAQGDLERVVEDWQYLPDSAHPGGLEVILQTHLFAGYPRTINALATVRSVGVSETADLPEEAGPEPTAWATAGERLCQTIYGGAYPKLRTRISSLHPDLDRWMVEVGYGRVLSRPGLTMRQRELAVLVVLAGQNVPAQLGSHLRGALIVGATKEECRAVLSQTEWVWGARSQQDVDAVWRDLCEKGVV